MEEKTKFKTKEVAKFLGVSEATIYRMEKRGLVTSTRTPGGQRRFGKESIESYLRKSKSFEAPQNPSQFKKSLALVKEPESVYLPESLTNVEKEINNIISNKLLETNSPFFKTDRAAIYNADIIKIASIENKTIDLIATSPPYNVDIKYNSHNDTMSYDEYLSFTREWMGKCYHMLKDDGRFCLNIPLDKNKNGQQSVCADITTIAKKIGFKYHSTIIWNEQNISRRTAWGSWMSAAAPYVIAPVEVIVILYKINWKKISGSRKSDITKREFMEWTNGVWTFTGESKKRIGHPAPFPVELPRRCIKLFSFLDDVILDPFLGSGSTLVASLQTGRIGIGIDIDANYCEIAKKRLIKQINAQPVI